MFSGNNNMLASIFLVLSGRSGWNFYNFLTLLKKNLHVTFQFLPRLAH